MRQAVCDLILSSRQAKRSVSRLAKRQFDQSSKAYTMNNHSVANGTFKNRFNVFNEGVFRRNTN
jgi:hypothetical protein